MNRELRHKHTGLPLRKLGGMGMGLRFRRSAGHWGFGMDFEEMRFLDERD